MLKTLHGYLSRELVRTMFLALVAFTLVMTVFAVIEPMRKQGLTGQQVLSLFGYTIPIMLTLTMPIAALFATTIVYGRFSQENELMACRASGIATYTLIRPALVLGIVITAASLWLSNSIAPDLAQRANTSIKNNVRGVVYSRLNQRGNVRHGPQILHAEEVDPENDTLYGMIMVDYGNPSDIMLVVAPRTQLSFLQNEGEMYASVWMEDAVVTRVGQYDVGRQSYSPIDSIPVDSVMKEDPSWYRWGRLRRTLQNPVENADIHRRLEGVRRNIGREMLATRICQAIESESEYSGLQGADTTIVLRAPVAIKDGYKVELTGAEGDEYPVLAQVAGPTSRRLIEAQSAVIEHDFSLRRNASIISLTFRGPVRTRVYLPDDNDNLVEPHWTYRDMVQVGDLRMPSDIASAIEKLDLNTLFREPNKLTSDPGILEKVEEIRQKYIRKLQGEILGEMHGRIAYGLSCFLLVASGAALGILYRGGQILSAFALSMIPAAVVIVMVLMGKVMAANPDVELMHGLAAIWGGIALLALGNIGLYAKIIRR